MSKLKHFVSAQETTFPALAVLSIPATSAPVERIFSHASFILGRNRHNLSDEKLEEELFYKVNVEFIANS